MRSKPLAVSVLLLAIFSVGFALNTLSISHVEILNPGESGNPFPEKAWLVTATISNSPSSDLWESGEQLVAGWFTPKDTEENVAGDRYINIDAVPTNQYCKYLFKPLGDGLYADDYLLGAYSLVPYDAPHRIYMATPGDIVAWFNDNCPVNCEVTGPFSYDCQPWTGYVVFLIDKSVAGGTYHDIACIYAKIPANQDFFVFREPTGQQELFFGVVVGVKDEYGHEERAVITNRNYTSAWIGDNVFAKLEGGLQTGLLCPDVSNWRIVPVSYYPETYVTISEEKLNQYRACLPKGSVNNPTLTDTPIYDAVERWYNGYADWSEVQAVVDDCNYLRSIVLNGEDFLNPEENPEINPEIPQRVVEYKITGDYMKIVFKNKLLTNPVIRLFIDSDWVKILIMIPRPDIVSVPSTITLQNNIQASLPIQIKNIGDAPGDITVTVDCGPISVYPSTVQTISLEPGELKTVTFALSYGAQVPGNEAYYTCTITAYATLNPSLKDTATVNVHYIYSGLGCIPGTKWCEGTKIMYCTQDREVEVYFDCATKGDYTCGYTDSEPVCIESHVPGGPGGRGPEWLKWLTYIAIGLGLAIVLILIIEKVLQKGEVKGS